MDFFSYNNNHIFHAQSATAASSLRSNSSCFHASIFYLACLLSNCLCHQPSKSSDLNLPFQVVPFLIAFVLLISEHILSGRPSQTTPWFSLGCLSCSQFSILKINIISVISLCTCKIYHEKASQFTQSQNRFIKSLSCQAMGKPKNKLNNVVHLFTALYFTKCFQVG